MEIHDLGPRRELFVDDSLLAEFSGDARLKLHPPQRREIVLQVEPPLENSCSLVYAVVLECEGQYRLYYRGNFPKDIARGESKLPTAHVAFSDDGSHFTRPELGLVDLDDGARNNVVWQGVHAHNFIPFLDPDPASPAERFKAVGAAGMGKLHAFVSPDGLRWRLLQDAPLPVPGAFDSANLVFRDPITGKYRLFSRFGQEGRGRAIQSCESDDFRQWTEPVPHRYAEDAPPEQFYTNATQPCPGAEHLLLSFPMRYVGERTTPVADLGAMDYPGSATPGMTGITDAVFMSSRDGVYWHRPHLEAWLRPGLDERNWTHRNSTPAIGILPLQTDEWSMYLSEHYAWPDNRLRRLSLRPWGFGSLHAGYRGGAATTRPLRFVGDELRLNVSTSAVGSVRVAVQHADGRLIDGLSAADQEPFYGDRLDQPLRWAPGANLASLAGQAIRLRFELHDADVFAFRFASATNPETAP